MKYFIYVCSYKKDCLCHCCDLVYSSIFQYNNIMSYLIITIIFTSCFSRLHLKIYQIIISVLNIFIIKFNNVVLYTQLYIYGCLIVVFCFILNSLCLMTLDNILRHCTMPIAYSACKMFNFSFY